MKCYVDISYLVYETLISGTIRGAQRVQAEIINEMILARRVTPVIFLKGRFREIGEELALRIVRGQKGHELELGLVRRGKSSGGGRVKLSPQIRRRISGIPLWLQDLTFSVVCFLLPNTKRYQLQNSSQIATPVSFREGDCLIELGMPSDVGLIREIQLLKMQGVKYTLLVHDLIYLTQPYLFKFSKKYRSRISGLLELADLIIVTTEYVKNHIVEWWPYFFKKTIDGPKISVIPLSGMRGNITEGKVSLDDKKISSLGSFALSVGSMETRKNYPILLEALRLVSASSPDFKLVIVARRDSMTKEAIDLFGKYKSIEENIIFLEDVSDTDLDVLIDACDFMIHPALIEGFGLPPLEAAARGKICIVSDAPALVEIAPGMPRFERLSASSCAEQISLLRLMSNLERSEMIAQNPLCGWTWSDVGGAILDETIKQK